MLIEGAGGIGTLDFYLGKCDGIAGVEMRKERKDLDNDAEASGEEFFGLVVKMQPTGGAGGIGKLDFGKKT